MQSATTWWPNCTFSRFTNQHHLEKEEEREWGREEFRERGKRAATFLLLLPLPRHPPRWLKYRRDEFILQFPDLCSISCRRGTGAIKAEKERMPLMVCRWMLVLMAMKSVLWDSVAGKMQLHHFNCPRLRWIYRQIHVAKGGKAWNHSFCGFLVLRIA